MLLVALLGCAPEAAPRPRDPPAAPAPALEVPDTLAFSALQNQETEVLPLELRNAGDAPLHVARVRRRSGRAFAVDEVTDLVLEPGDTRGVEVVFSPLGAGENLGTIEIESDDPGGVRTVDLVGRGVTSLARVTPEAWDFGAVPVPCDAWTAVTIENVGEIPLEVFGVTLGGDDRFRLEDPLLTGRSLPVGESLVVRVGFETDRLGDPAEGELDVVTNDPWGFRGTRLTAAPVYVARRDEAFRGAGRRTFELADVPVPASVEVAVDGATTWDFAIAGRRITLDADAPDGEVVEIAYGVAADCR